MSKQDLSEQELSKHELTGKDVTNMVDRLAHQQARLYEHLQKIFLLAEIDRLVKKGLTKNQAMSELVANLPWANPGWLSLQTGGAALAERQERLQMQERAAASTH